MSGSRASQARLIAAAAEKAKNGKILFGLCAVRLAIEGQPEDVEAVFATSSFGKDDARIATRAEKAR